MTTLEIVTLTTASIGAVCGLIGATLGVINTWHQMSRNKVRLRVVPKVAFTDPNGRAITGDRPDPILYRFFESGVPWRLCVEVVNLSAFPVTVAEVGFGQGPSNERLVLMEPELSPPGKSLPVRLEPRESITAYSTVGIQLDLSFMRRPVAFARTDCGYNQYGSSPILKHYLETMASRKDTGS